MKRVVKFVNEMQFNLQWLNRLGAKKEKGATFWPCSYLGKREGSFIIQKKNRSRTILSSELWTILLPETRVTTARVSGRKETKCHVWCLKKQSINVAGQGLPKHLNIWIML